MTDDAISPVAPAHDRGHDGPRLHRLPRSEDTSRRSGDSRSFWAARRIRPTAEELRRFQLQMRLEERRRRP